MDEREPLDVQFEENVRLLDLLAKEHARVEKLTVQLEHLIYCITTEPRRFRWHEGVIEWSRDVDPPEWKALGEVGE